MGYTAQFNSTDIDITSLKNDGYKVKTVGENIFIAGISDLATQYGVYTFIERFLGVRWLNQSYTYIPTSSTITVNQCDITDQAIFEDRIYYSGVSVLTTNSASYREHSRFHENTARPKGVPGGHTTTVYVNKNHISPDGNGVETLGQKHPEYFTDYTNSGHIDYDLCFTNGIDENGNLKSGQSVASLMIGKLIEYLRNDENIEYFMVGITDNGEICHCATCDARRAIYKESGISVIFMNCIEENVNTWIRENQQGRKEVNIMMFAYQKTAEPPIGDDGSVLCYANDNVYVRIAPIEADWTYSLTDERQKTEIKDRLEGWKKVVKNFAMWDYNNNFHEVLWYFPSLHYLKENLEYYRDMGVVDLFSESSTAQKERWFDDIKSYVASRLYWNLDWSVEQLVNEYIELYYGNASDTVKKVFKILDDYYAGLRDKGLLDVKILTSGNYFEPSYYNKNLMTTLISLIEQEEKNIALDSSIDEHEKIRITKALWSVKLTPMTMIFRNYDSYYSNGKAEFATKYFQICKTLGINSLGLKTLNELATENNVDLSKISILSFDFSGDIYADDIYQ